MRLRSAVFAALALAAVSSAQSLDAAKAAKQSSGLVTPSASGDTYLFGKVVAVYSGDAFTVESDGRRYFVKLQSLDAPEAGQSYFENSQKTLSKLINKKEVRIVVSARDGNDSLIGMVYYDDRDIGLRLLEKGMAWYSKKSASAQTPDGRKIYADAQAHASSEAIGLWAEDKPVPPWVFRGEDTPSDAAGVEPEKPEAAEVSTPTPLVDDGRKYVLGPRGGCYYVAESGRRVYVKDKRRCGVTAADAKP